MQPCPSKAQLKFSYVTPRPISSPALLQPTPAVLYIVQLSLALVLLQPPFPALLWPWPGAPMIQSACSSPAPAYSSPAPIPPSPMLQSLPALIKTLPALAQLMPAQLPQLQPSLDLLKLSSNQCPDPGFCPGPCSCHSPDSYSGSAPCPTSAPARSRLLSRLLPHHLHQLLL